MMAALGAAIYGAGRARVSNALLPITAKVPLGSIADEVVMLGAGYAAHKFFPNKHVRAVTKAGMLIEAARIGEAVVSGNIMGGGSSPSSGLF